MDVSAGFISFFWLTNLIKNDYLIKSVQELTYLGRKNNNFSQSLPVHTARGSKLEQHNREYMQPRFHAEQYKALKKPCFLSTSPTRIFGDF